MQFNLYYQQMQEQHCECNYTLQKKKKKASSNLPDISHLNKCSPLIYFYMELIQFQTLNYENELRTNIYMPLAKVD